VPEHFSLSLAKQAFFVIGLWAFVDVERICEIHLKHIISIVALSNKNQVPFVNRNLCSKIGISCI